MVISLHQVVPIPLNNKLNRKSEIWNTNIEFRKEKFTKIVATSGTGKTTLIHVIYGLRKDYTGTVMYNKKHLNEFDDEEIAAIRQLNLSVVFQDLKLFPKLTAFENINLNRTMQQPFYEEHKINEMADELRITEILHQNIEKCSYGEQQRVAIIRALMQPFEILLLDEPFSHLDIANTNKAAALINKECKARNAGFILTDLDEDNHFDYDVILHL